MLLWLIVDWPTLNLVPSFNNHKESPRSLILTLAYSINDFNDRGGTMQTGSAQPRSSPTAPAQLSLWFRVLTAPLPPSFPPSLASHTSQGKGRILI